MEEIKNNMKCYHTLEPFYNKDSRVLILGSFPSVRSRELGFYYYHSQNRFWKILSIIFNEKINQDIESKKEFLLRHNIALWDVVGECDINGSNDSSIKNVIVNDLSKIIKESKIDTIITTGRKAFELYNRYCLKDTKKEAILLPSTSPLNCSYSLEKLVEEYKIMLSLLK